MSTLNDSGEGSGASDLYLRDDVHVVQISETVHWCIPKDTSKLSEVQKRIFYMQKDILVMVAQLQKQTDALWEAVSRIEEESAPSCRNGDNQDKSATDNEETSE